MGKKSGTNSFKVLKDNKGSIIMTTNAAYLSGAKAAITFSNDYFYEDKDTKPRAFPDSEKYKNIKYIPWGDDNLYPQNTVDTTEKSPVAMMLIDFKTDLSFGSGVKLGHYVDGELKEYTQEEILASDELKAVQDWINDNNLNSEFAEICMDEVWWDQADVELILSGDRKTIAQVNSKDKVFSRWSEMNGDGKIEWHLYSSKWAETVDASNTVFTKCLDFKKPGHDLKVKMGLRPNENGEFKPDSEARYIYPIRHASPGRKYYPFASWHSIIKSGWMDFANAIPVFKKALMTNSLTVKYHIEISMDYFPRIFNELGLSKIEEREARRNLEYQQIQDFLTGAENTGKPWISYYKVTPDGKVEIHDIKITKIDNKIGGEYLEDSQEASAMTYNAFGVHPNLTGVIPSKNSSNLSGSDKRELLRIAQTLQVRKRQKKLELLNLIREVNGWPDYLILYISDIILTTLDQGKEVETIDTKA
jgi:hypothetical protein